MIDVILFSRNFVIGRKYFCNPKYQIRPFTIYPKLGEPYVQHRLFRLARQARLKAKETLPAKLDLILERLNLRERVKDETVAIKMHTGNNIGYSTVHPVFVRKVVQAIKDGGGKPFIADVNWDVEGAEQRGYSHETLGCPVYPAAGPDDKYFYATTARSRTSRTGRSPD